MKSLGLALAGFGLIFIGIETLQAGMAGLSGVFNLARLPAGGLWGHSLAMVIGVLMTIIMQSSSAAVATTLTALATGTINFEQASSLVIGAAVGTTVTGALAAVGGSVPAKRTALAHVLFNLATGVIAIVLLPLFLWIIGLAQRHAGLEAGATSLAAFHTVFIAVGVAIFLPFAQPFARWIERRLPERGPRLTRHLDATLLHAPAVALEATRRALSETACALFAAVRVRLAAEAGGRAKPLHIQIQHALDQTQRFFATIPPVNEDEPPSALRVAQLHAIDHLTRLQGNLEPDGSVLRALTEECLSPMAAQARAILELGETGLSGEAPEDWLAQLERAAAGLAAQRRRERPLVLTQTAHGQGDPSKALEILDAMRWLDRVGYHTWRICNYLGGNGKAESVPAD